MDPHQLVAHLRTLGLDEASELAFGQTLTPETWLGLPPRGAPQEGAALSASRDGAGVGGRSVGELPHIALSGLGPLGGREASLGTSSPRSPQAPPAAGAADIEIVGLLGEGGMGRVYLARQRSLGREVAVKTLKAEVAAPQSVAMLRDEATTMGRLEHPNVVPVHAVGHDDQGQLVLIMKRVDGVSWRDLLQDPAHPRWQVLAPRQEDRLELHLDVLAQVSHALHFAHSRGVVHRDVKPENVLLGEHGEVYLADWGIATQLGSPGPAALVGTPTYMAPEMLLGDPARVDARTDVFLLGATLHEVLTGAPPHGGQSIHAVLLAAHAARPPTYGSGVPVELQVIARRAMASDPRDRYPSALAFREALAERRRRAAALAMTRSARDLLAELEAAVATPEPRGALDRQLTECRFAFVQALREWPESEDAREGLDAVLRLAVRHELARENLEAARHLLGELSAPDDGLVQAIAAVEEQLGARRRDIERLRARAVDEDLRVGLRSRMAVLGSLVALGIVISGYFSYGPGAVDGAPSHRAIITVAGLFVAIVSFAGLVLRRHLLANAAGRRAAALLGAGMLALLAHRLVGAAHGVPAAAVLAMDFVIIALVIANAGLLVPRVAWAAPIPLVGSALTLVFPGSVAQLFSGVSVVGVAAVAWLWLAGARSSEP